WHPGLELDPTPWIAPRRSLVRVRLEVECRVSRLDRLKRALMVEDQRRTDLQYVLSRAGAADQDSLSVQSIDQALGDVALQLPTDNQASPADTTHVDSLQPNDHLLPNPRRMLGESFVLDYVQHR